MAGLVLQCSECGWRPEDGITMGVVRAHFEVEHPGVELKLDLVLACTRCDQAMELTHHAGGFDHFECKPCHRTGQVRRG